MAPKRPFIKADEVEEPEVVEQADAPVAEPDRVTVINLLHDYGGRRTNELRIPPGLYKIDDPRLMGLGQYLVDSGHAVGINAQ